MKLTISVTYVAQAEFEAPDGLEGNELKVWVSENVDMPDKNEAEWVSTYVDSEDGTINECW